MFNILPISPESKILPPVYGICDTPIRCALESLELRSAVPETYNPLLSWCAATPRPAEELFPVLLLLAAGAMISFFFFFHSCS
jgi:hypothetical protein